MNNDKLRIYEAVRNVPEEAKKPITGGRLSGKTDINPMWRIKALTEQFGPCGTGWKYTIDRQWLEPGVNGEIAAYCNISLFYKTDEGWSEPIPGTGGSMYIAKEKSGLYTDDECFKKALTDAISVAAKALGVGADVYWDKDSTKYTQNESDHESHKKQPPKPKTVTPDAPDAPDALTEDDKARLKESLSTPERKEAGKNLLAKWGYEALKDLPHSRVEEFIATLEGA